MPAATKKRPPMEAEPGEGKAHEMKESPEEETREGSEMEESPRGRTNRKRSAKGVKNTKSPMDGESCNCGTKKGAKCSCDGGCGYSKKMDSALTPHEYLAACDLGIQDRSRSYIRARLDMADRFDKKCGASGIAENKKCNVGSGRSGKGSSLGTALKVIGTGAALGAAGVAGTALYQQYKAKSAVKNAHDVRRSSNIGIRASALVARKAVHAARKGWKDPKAAKVLTEDLVTQAGMMTIKKAKDRRTAAYAEARKALAEIKNQIPESGARRRRREASAASSTTTTTTPTRVQRRVRRQGRVTRMNSMYADGFNVNTTLLEI